MEKLTKLEQYFKAHFLVEMLYGRKGLPILENVKSVTAKHILFEQYGVFDGCDELAMQIEKEANKAQNNGLDWTLFKLPENKLANKVLITLCDGNSCAFLSNSTMSDDGKYDVLKLRLSRRSIRGERLIPSIMHELLHAYENLSRTTAGSEDLRKNALKTGYDRVTTDKIAKMGNEKKYVAYLLYYFSDFERNAYIAQLNGEAIACDKTFHSAHDALKWLYKTVPYHNYMVMLDYADKLSRIKNKERREYVLKTVNELSNHGFKTYGQFVKWLRVKTRKYSKKFQQTVPKIAAKHLPIAESFSSSVDFKLEIPKELLN